MLCGHAAHCMGERRMQRRRTNILNRSGKVFDKPHLRSRCGSSTNTSSAVKSTSGGPASASRGLRSSRGTLSSAALLRPSAAPSSSESALKADQRAGAPIVGAPGCVTSWRHLRDRHRTARSSGGRGSRHECARECDTLPPCAQDPFAAAAAAGDERTRQAGHERRASPAEWDVQRRAAPHLRRPGTLQLGQKLGRRRRVSPPLRPLLMTLMEARSRCRSFER